MNFLNRKMSLKIRKKKNCSESLKQCGFLLKKDEIDYEEPTAQNPMEIEKEGKKQRRTTLVLLLNFLRLI